MKTLHRPCALVLLAAGASAWAGDASVVFVQPEQFRDAGYARALPSDRDRAVVLRDVEQHLKQLATRGLPAGESLAIEVLDIDLAGHFEPMRRAGPDVRIVRDVTWPRIQLRYALSRDGQVVDRGEEAVTDMNFLMAVNRYASEDRLRYERAMLDAWFEKRFARRAS